MFAVVILGIGFIMIAAIFPVAIRQGQASAEESTAVTAAQRAIATIASRATDALFPPTTIPLANNTTDMVTLYTPMEYHPPYLTLGEVYKRPDGKYPFSSPSPYNSVGPAEIVARQQWLGLRGDLISTADGRLGFALAYSRGNSYYSQQTSGGVIQPASAARTADVVMVVAQNRNRPLFNDEDASTGINNWLRDFRIPNSSDDYKTVNHQMLYAGGAPATLQLKRMGSQFLLGQNGAPDQIRFLADSGSSATPTIPTGVPTTGWPMAPGCFVIVADAAFGSATTVKAQTAAITSFPNARANGRVFRLGAEVVGQTYPTFELLAGQDISSIPRRPNATVDRSHMDAPPYFSPSWPGATNTGRVDVLVLGRALQNPVVPYDNATNPYVGPPMDVAVYRTTVGVKP